MNESTIRYAKVEDLDSKIDLVKNLSREALKRYAADYADIRLELVEKLSVGVEDGVPRKIKRDFELYLGVRLIAGDQIKASGEDGKYLGPSDFADLEKVIADSFMSAHYRARAKSRSKSEMKKSGGALVKTIVSTELAAIPISVKTIRGQCKIDPRTVDAKKLSAYLAGIYSEAKKRYPRIVKNLLDCDLSYERKLFSSSEGTFIDSLYAFSGGTPIFVTYEPGHKTLDVMHGFGSQAGAESFFGRENSYGLTFEEFCLDLAKEANDLVVAPSLPPSEKPVVVVTDPDFNALMSHEIVAHPSELDRAMKFETGYAGRSWFMKNPTDNMIGKPVGSPLLNAFSDPNLTGAYGHYEFDDEGTPAKRVWHIREGIFCDFLNSRQTAAMFGAEPNGHFLASNASMVPVVRMSVSSFAPGKSDPQDIVKEVENGWYFVGYRMPAIAESRENFRLAGRKTYRIKNGELKEPYRDGSVVSDTKDFFMTVDAVGNDWRIFSIPNCGKGQPMQTKRVGNGGPTMRSRAKIAGGEQQ